MNWGEWAMKLKKSLFSRGLIISDIKRFWWVSTLYGIILLIILPLQQITVEFPIKDQWRRKEILDMLMLDNNSPQILLIYIVPVILAVLLFRYMHVSKSAAIIHAMPYSRKTLFFNHGAAGFLLLTIPVIVTGMVLTALQISTPLGEVYSLPQILQWVSLTLLFNYLFFAIAVFVGMFTGSAIAHIVFTYIFHVLPAGIYVLIGYNLKYLLHGFSETSISSQTWIGILPLFKLLGFEIEEFTVIYTVGYIVAIALFLFMAMILYEKRQLETAGDIVVFPVMKPVFKYGVAACGMLLGGVYFYHMANQSFGMLLFGYFISSFFGYWISEILLQKSFKVWRAYKGYIAYAAVVVVLLTSLSVDVFGYVRRIPQLGQIEKVYFGNYFGNWSDLDKAVEIGNSRVKYSDIYVIQQTENIKNIIQLHKALIQKPYQKEGMNRHIIYKLKNGRYLVRNYLIDETHQAPFLKPIYASMEYKIQRFPVLKQQAKDIETIEIEDSRTDKNPMILADKQDIEGLIQHLQQELREADFEEFSERNEGYVYIRIRDVEDRIVHYNLRKSYTSVIQWLQDKGYYEKIMLMPEEIESAVLIKGKVTTEYYYGKMMEDKAAKRVEIKDKQIIQKILETYSPYQHKRRNEDAIVVGFYLKNSPKYVWTQGFLFEDSAILQELEPYLKQLN